MYSRRCEPFLHPIQSALLEPGPFFERDIISAEQTNLLPVVLFGTRNRQPRVEQNHSFLVWCQIKRIVLDIWFTCLRQGCTQNDFWHKFFQFSLLKVWTCLVKMYCFRPKTEYDCFAQDTGSQDCQWYFCCRTSNTVYMTPNGRQFTHSRLQNSLSAISVQQLHSLAIKTSQLYESLRATQSPLFRYHSTHQLTSHRFHWLSNHQVSNNHAKTKQPKEADLVSFSSPLHWVGPVLTGASCCECYPSSPLVQTLLFWNKQGAP